jgi:hypothetical protein
MLVLGHSPSLKLRPRVEHGLCLAGTGRITSVSRPRAELSFPASDRIDGAAGTWVAG